MSSQAPSYRGYRFPPEIISHAVWLYHRFSLSFRDAEDLLAQRIDATTPAGRLQMHILGAIAEFERGRIAERVRLGLERVRAQGRTLGRPKVELTEKQLATVKGLGVREAAQKLGISASTLYRRLSQEPT